MGPRVRCILVHVCCMRSRMQHGWLYVILWVKVWVRYMRTEGKCGDKFFCGQYGRIFMRRIAKETCEGFYGRGNNARETLKCGCQFAD